MGMLSNNGQTGGLSGLVERFQQAGLGDVIGSWVGTGRNLPISGEQIRQALGNDRLQQISEETGLPPEETAEHLSGVLPEAVDKLTPEGQVPSSGLGDIGSLLGRLRG
jgi:uncharacterized protein YidB (DUF937 family)